MVLHFLGNAKNCEKVGIQLEEREKEEKMKDLEHGSSCVDVGSLEREIEEILKD